MEPSSVLWAWLVLIFFHPLSGTNFNGDKGDCLKYLVQLVNLVYALLQISFNTLNGTTKAPALDLLRSKLYKVSSNILNTRDSVSSGYPNTEKRVENTTRSGVFLTKFEVFG